MRRSKFPMHARLLKRSSGVERAARRRRWLAVLLLLEVTGCGPLRRVRECRRISETINGALQDLQPRVAGAGDSPVAYAQLSKDYEALEKQLATLLPARDPALSKALSGYRELTARAAKQSQVFAEELDKPADSPEERTEKETRLGRLRAQAKAELARETNLVRKLDTLCHPQ